MRIIKYIFLLIVLAVIAVSVYVATQKGEFEVTTSAIVDVPRAVAFNYVNDYRNWEDWSAWKKSDPGMSYRYGENTVGQGGSYSWSGAEGDGRMTTVFVKENDSIAQRVIFSGTPSNGYITFKDTLGKTKITWHAKGKINFMGKVHATFSGGVDRMVAKMYQSSLENLRTLLTTEIRKYNIQVDGLSQVPATIFIKQTIRCKAGDVQSRILYYLPKMIKFLEKNNIATKGSPFVIYDNAVAQASLVTFSICAPLSEEIFLGAGSDMSVEKSEAFAAIKITLFGDYSHRSEMRKKASDYMTLNNFTENTAIKRREVYVKSASIVKSPSQWETQLLIPIRSSASTVTPPASTPAAASATPPPPAVRRPVPSQATPVTPTTSESATEQ
jgi:hypothetical protein